ncbi:hypothetical protein D1227_06510 [Henriciella mobilis]|uniref:hypothetical protein n=1 Tax=Henriciella mobilis TaxID=2305467 RepID=UPI000E65FF22|nr:hypothetical protein [Henriciella mobilis]RIJ15938.1 hypothetical protein D1231_09090 [Henriciella mobilis]RIJ21148.1 hypothetical protein D1227_12630 [Henriciella mobilis]RIJ23152.1 hypothetical protein D1227_06510 [Henriciella mobilis]
MKTPALILAAALTCACASADIRDRETVSQSVIVPEVYNAETAQKAYDTLRIAAERACEHTDHAYTYRHRKADTKRCVAEAIESGVESVNDPRLTAIHEAAQ